MTQAVLSLIPVFALILMGFLIKHRKLAPESFWVTAEKFTYYIFFPALLIGNTASASLGGLPVVALAGASISGILLVAAILMILRPLTGLDGPAFTSVFQGAIRPNSYVAIAAIVALFGQAGLTVVSLILVFVLPLVNFLSVFLLVRTIPPASATSSWSDPFKEVAKNPIILAIFIGLLLNGSGLGSPPVIGDLLDILGRAALPMGLLAVGAGLDMGAARDGIKGIALATVLKLLATPLLTAFACTLFEVHGLIAGVAILYASVPCSASSYVLTRQLGGDARLMAGIITVTTLVAMASIPFILAVSN